MTAIVETTDLSKTYGQGHQTVHAVRDINLSVGSGRFLAVTGPSGSGKSTLLALIGGLLSPTSGKVIVNHHAVHELTGRKRARFRSRHVGFVFQSSNLIPYLTARENIAVLAAIANADRADVMRRADHLIDELGLVDRADTITTRLSGGERQRVAIARALVNQPDVILVDEPTASLDRERGRQVVAELRAQIRRRGLIGIMVTHDLEMAELADHVVEMRDGRLLGQPLSVTGG